MGTFLTIVEVSEIKSGEGKSFPVAGESIAIFNADGAFYAVENRCIRGDQMLARGVLRGSEIECPADGLKVYLPTGEVTSIHDRRRLKTYRVSIEGNKVKVELSNQQKDDRRLVRVWRDPAFRELR